MYVLWIIGSAYILKIAIHTRERRILLQFEDIADTIDLWQEFWIGTNVRK